MLISKAVTAALSHYNHIETLHNIIRIIPQDRRKEHTLMLNVYSPHKNRRANFAGILVEVESMACTKAHAVLVGNSNAPNMTWGYIQDTFKRRSMEREATDVVYQLITRPSAPTRVGNSFTRDTNSDLTLTLNVRRDIGEPKRKLWTAITTLLALRYSHQRFVE
ncbi:hypothetical protein HPB49_010966 [Dermacentor silvarum]|uniref:Uncharacterized protein n=1 Tax=Dermacentor silvarum TaxID=543639 RepID=A0ACB8D579_DERSI|nr:hypothetical protein HPB49_010966 [Dermacentor silvarum]